MPEDTMTQETVNKMRLTTKEALKELGRAKRNGARVCIHVHMDAPLVDNPERVFPGAAGGYLNLSHRQAREFVKTALSSTIEARGGRLPLTYRTWSDRTTLWIG